MQELGKFNLNANVIKVRNKKKYATFSLFNNLVSIDSLHFLNSSLDS